jgi:hypothetical protein
MGIEVLFICVRACVGPALAVSSACITRALLLLKRAEKIYGQMVSIWADGLYIAREHLLVTVTVIYTQMRTHQHLSVVAYLVRATSAYVSIRLSFRVHGDLPGIFLLKNRYFSIALIMWASAVFSAFIDNIPFTATMVPVMMQLAQSVGEISRLMHTREIYEVYVSIRQRTSEYVSIREFKPFCW